MDEVLLTHVADIVAAHVSNNAVAPKELPGLIQAVHASISALGLEKQIEQPATRPVPAVPIRASVKPDAVTCLECGTKLKVLRRHLYAEHGMTPEEYRARWKLPDHHPLVAPDYAARRKVMAMQFGLGRKRGETRKSRHPAIKARSKPEAST